MLAVPSTTNAELKKSALRANAKTRVFLAKWFAVAHVSIRIQAQNSVGQIRRAVVLFLVRSLRIVSMENAS